MKWSSVGREFLAAVLVMVSLDFGLGGRIQAVPPSYPFTDDVEVAGANKWSADSPWARTTTDAHSASSSWTDSAGGDYANNLDIKLTLASPVDLSAAVKPQLKFWHHYQLGAWVTSN